MLRIPDLQHFAAPPGDTFLSQAVTLEVMSRGSAIHKVLVVDDDEGLLRSWKRLISRECQCWTSSNPTTAMELVREHKPDLAIIDLRLGRKAGLDNSGLDLVKQIKKEIPAVKIALCSGYLSVTTTEAGVRAGADIVVFKPITFDEIRRRIAGEPEALPPPEEVPTLARAEWEHISRVLADCNGNVSMAARRLGIYRSSLQRRLRKYAPQK